MQICPEMLELTEQMCHIFMTLQASHTSHTQGEHADYGEISIILLTNHAEPVQNSSSHGSEKLRKV